MRTNRNHLDVTALFYVVAVVGGRHGMHLAQLLSTGPAAMAQASVSLNPEAQSFQRFSGAYGTRHHEDHHALRKK